MFTTVLSNLQHCTNTFTSVLSNLQHCTPTLTTVLSNLQHCTPTLLLQYCQTFSTVPTLLQQYCQTFSTVPQHFYYSTVKPSALYPNTFTTVLSNLQHCTSTLLLQYCQTFSTVPQHFYYSTVKPAIPGIRQSKVTEGMTNRVEVTGGLQLGGVDVQQQHTHVTHW